MSAKYYENPRNTPTWLKKRTKKVAKFWNKRARAYARKQRELARLYP